jgi:hypothetical protein
MIGAFGLTEKRNRLIDFPYRISEISMAIMIPKPVMKQKNSYVTAVWEPFQPLVEIILVIAIPFNFAKAINVMDRFGSLCFFQC